MNIAARTALSALVASLVPALPFVVISLLDEGNMQSLLAALIAWSIGAAHIGALGIPAFALLWHMQIANRWSLMLAGFILGFVPFALIALPNLLQGGAPGLSGPFTFGVLGAFSAWVFWVVWYRLGPNNSFKPKPLRGSA